MWKTKQDGKKKLASALRALKDNGRFSSSSKAVASPLLFPVVQQLLQIIASATLYIWKLCMRLSLLLDRYFSDIWWIDLLIATFLIFFTCFDSTVANDQVNTFFSNSTIIRHHDHEDKEILSDFSISTTINLLHYLHLHSFTLTTWPVMFRNPSQWQ